MKYYLVKLKTRSGEYEFETDYLIEREDNLDIDKEADEIAATWYGGRRGEKYPENKGYYFNGGEIYVEVESVRELNYPVYTILKEYL
jgi:hypothetical protein